MKKAIMFAAMLALATSAFAQVTPQAASLLDKQNALVAEATQIRAEYGALDQEDKALVKRNDDISWGYQQFKKQVDQYKQAQATHNQEVAQYEASAADHNRRCTGTFNDHNYVVACNNEIPAGNAWKARINAETANLNETLSKLRQIQEATTQSTTEVFNRRKAIRARQNDIQARFSQIQAEYKAIQSQISNCKAQLGSTNTDKAHDVCGEMFDGNKTPNKHTPGPNGQ